MAENEEYYEPDIISVTDDDGNELLFELLERYETDDDVYVAITKYNETDEDIEFQTLWENEILDVKDSYNIFPDNTFYHSYEEALEVGLQEALKLIK